MTGIEIFNNFIDIDDNYGLIRLCVEKREIQRLNSKDMTCDENEPIAKSLK